MLEQKQNIFNFFSQAAWSNKIEEDIGFFLFILLYKLSKIIFKYVPEVLNV